MVSKEELLRNAATLTKNVKGCSNESALVALEDKDGELEGVNLCPNTLTDQDFVHITIDAEEDFFRNMLPKKRRVRKPEYSLKSQSGISVKPHCMKTRNHKAGKKEPQNEGVTIAQSEKVSNEFEILHTGFLCKSSSSLNSQLSINKPNSIGIATRMEKPISNPCILHGNNS
ncbi:hypothetical protein Q3G72_017068 [Acer saccharum]|nr:hypothetical protein Q3G72_017068 [Acer saccharum]